MKNRWSNTRRFCKTLVGIRKVIDDKFLPRELISDHLDIHTLSHAEPDGADEIFVDPGLKFSHPRLRIVSEVSKRWLWSRKLRNVTHVWCETNRMECVVFRWRRWICCDGRECRISFTHSNMFRVCLKAGEDDVMMRWRRRRNGQWIGGWGIVVGRTYQRVVFASPVTLPDEPSTPPCWAKGAGDPPSWPPCWIGCCCCWGGMPWGGAPPCCIPLPLFSAANWPCWLGSYWNAIVLLMTDADGSTRLLQYCMTNCWEIGRIESCVCVVRRRRLTLKVRDEDQIVRRIYSLQVSEVLEEMIRL